MISIGDNNISDILIGEDIICKVCKGEDIVFENVYIPPLSSEIGVNNSMNYAYLIGDLSSDYSGGMNAFNNNVYIFIHASGTINFYNYNMALPQFTIIENIKLTDNYRSVSNGNPKSSGSPSDIPYPMGVIEFEDTKISNYHKILFNEINPSLADATNINIDDIQYPTLEQLIKSIIEYHSSTKDETLYDRFYNKDNSNKINEFSLTLYTTTIENNENSKRRASNIRLNFERQIDGKTYSGYKVNYEINPNANSVGV